MAYFVTYQNDEGNECLIYNGAFIDIDSAYISAREMRRLHSSVTYTVCNTLLGVTVEPEVRELYEEGDRDNLARPDQLAIIDDELAALVALDSLTANFERETDEAPQPQPQPEPQPQFVFEVRKGLKDTPKDQWEVIASYPDIENAKTYLEAVKMLDPDFAYTIKKVPTSGEQLDANWRDREQERFDSGRYKPVPWSEYAHLWSDHFAHIAESDSRKVAYTESEEKGLRDIQKVITPQAYLERFFSGVLTCPAGFTPNLLPHTREAYCDEMSGQSADVKFTGLGNADLMERVYVSCREDSKYEVSSCMTYKASHFSSFMHPVRVYALGGELELAYLTDDQGVVSARCLVWPERKVWGRTYGERSNKLTKGLRALGYTHGSPSALEGAKFARVPNDPDDPDCKQFVVPYLDGNHKFADSPCGKFFIIDEGGPYCGEQQDGLSYLEEMRYCDRCEESTSSDVYGVGNETWCESCYENSAFTCADCVEADHTDNAITTIYSMSGRYPYTHLVCETCAGENYSTVDGQDCPVANHLVTPCGDCSDTVLTSDIVYYPGDIDRCNACSETHEAELAEVLEAASQPQLPIEQEAA